MRGAISERSTAEDDRSSASPVIEIRRARGRLVPHVESYFLYRCDAPELHGFSRVDSGQIRFTIRGQGEITFPDGHVETIKPIVVAGPGTAAARHRMVGPLLCFGVNLRPIGWKALIGLPANQAADHLIDGKRLFCEQAPMLLERLRGMEALDDMVAALAPLLIMRQEEVKPIPEAHYPFLRRVREWAAAEDPTIDSLYAAIQATSGLGARQVQRLCLEYFGAPPSHLKRKFRAIRAAMKLYQGAPLSEVIAPFADQSHMINEIRHFTGHTPTGLRASPDPVLALRLRNQAFQILPDVVPEKVDLTAE